MDHHHTTTTVPNTAWSETTWITTTAGMNRTDDTIDASNGANHLSSSQPAELRPLFQVSLAQEKVTELMRPSISRTTPAVQQMTPATTHFTPRTSSSVDTMRMILTMPEAHTVSVPNDSVRLDVHPVQRDGSLIQSRFVPLLPLLPDSSIVPFYQAHQNCRQSSHKHHDTFDTAFSRNLLPSHHQSIDPIYHPTVSNPFTTTSRGEQQQKYLAYTPSNSLLYPCTPPTLASRTSIDCPPENATIHPTIPSALPSILARLDDSVYLTPHQAYLRQQIEVFVATIQDTSIHIRGRSKTIHLGQVGVRCRHCSHIPGLKRAKGSTFFPISIQGFYQAAQNMCSTHLQCGLCPETPDSVKDHFAQLLAKKSKTTTGSGRTYWTRCAQEMGLVDTDRGVFLYTMIPIGVNIVDMDPTMYRSSKKRKHETSEGPK